MQTPSRQFNRMKVEFKSSKTVCGALFQSMDRRKEKCAKPENDIQRSELGLEFQAAAGETRYI